MFAGNFSRFTAAVKPELSGNKPDHVRRQVGKISRARETNSWKGKV